MEAIDQGFADVEHHLKPSGIQLRLPSADAD